MKIYQKQNVLDAALDRIRYLFDEFPNVVVGMSGGKDSTVVFHLALQVARETKRLPLKVMWIDQEAEWQSTVDYVETIMSKPDVDPYWFQMPMVITNNASSYERYSQCWNETDKDKWIHPQHPMSMKENKYGTERFHELFNAIFSIEFDDCTILLGGVRCEESPSRQAGLTCGLTYKNITWGKVLNKKKNQYTFYPIYDWSYSDVWKYIHTGQLEYNRVYDAMYQYGETISNMRVSNLHHETALHTLLLVQEIEPDTWNRIAVRLDGANSVKHLQKEHWTCPAILPEMFDCWKEYALYLADHIIQENQYKLLLKKKIEETEMVYNGILIVDDYWKVIVTTILASDWDFTKLTNWINGKTVTAYRKVKMKHKLIRELLNHTRYLTSDMKAELAGHFIDEQIVRTNTATV